MESLELMPTRVRITAILRKAIYAGEYRGEDELSLTEIASRLGVSRTPVREAFQELESEGLITLRMNKGAIVNTIDRKFIRDILEMRILLESEAAARAAARGMETEALLERLEALRLQEGPLDRAEYVALNQAIHTAIWQAADNHQLRSFLLGLWNGPSVGSGQEEQQHFRNSTYEHIAILHFIRDGQAEEARRAMIQHISRSMDNLLGAENRDPQAESALNCPKKT